MQLFFQKIHKKREPVTVLLLKYRVVNQSVAVRCRRRQLVAPFILRMSVVSFHPDKSHLMGCFCLQKPFPEIRVLHWLFLAVDPVFLQPGINPVLVKGIHQIFGIGIQFHLAGPVQRFQSHNGRHQLHTVVGGFLIAL